MIDFIKNLFKKEQKEIEKISFDQLNEWFDKRSSSYHDEFSKKKDEQNSKIKEALKKTKESIEKLNSAELRNKNIPMREGQFMEGNREAYIKRAGLFLDKIELPDKIEEIHDFYSFFENELDSFKKSTMKPYQILQHFFGHETNDILHNIKVIDDLAKELDKITKDKKISSISSVNKKIDNIRNKQILKEELKKTLIEKEQEKTELKEEVNENEKGLAELKKSNEFTAHSKKTDDLKKVKNKIIEKDKELTAEFSVLEKAMKKYAKISFEHESLINKYIINPADTLLDDTELNILKVFEKLSSSIVMDQIELKEKKKEKSLKRIRKLDKEFFENFLLGYNKLINEKTMLEKEIDESNITQIFHTLKDKLEKNKESLENIKKNIEQMKDDVDNINIKKMKNELENEIKEVSEEEIIIT